MRPSIQSANSRFWAITLLCLIVAAAVASCNAALSQPAATSSTQLPNGVELKSGSSTLDVQVLEDRVVRVHVRPRGESTPPTLVMDPHPVLHPPSAVRASERSGVYTLSTPDLSVEILEKSPFSISISDDTGHKLLRSPDPFAEARDAGLMMHHAPGGDFYGIHGLGRDDSSVGLTRDSGGHVAAGVQGDSGAPFIFNVRYGVLVDSNGGDFTADSDSLAFHHDSRPDVEYFVLVGPPLKTMAALSRLVGPPPLPPEWTLGFLNSQWGSDQAEVEQIVARYRAEKIPLDAFILDFDWKAWGEDNYGEWRWNSTSGPGNVAPDKFPDGASGLFAQRLAAEGVKLAGILKPRILTTVAGDPNKPTEAAAYATDHHLWYPNEVLSPDYFSHRMAGDLNFNDPETRAWYWQHLLPAFHAGMAGWWNDEADVSGKLIFDNFQFLNMGRMLYDGQRSAANQRVWSINRNFYLGASRYGYAGWSGDIETGFSSMAFQRRRMLAALDTGEFNWSMDAGGFSGHPNPENYARWIEFAALVPIMRVHGGLNEKRQPWVYGPVAEAAARDAIDLRYRLLPYIYSYERLNTEGQVGLIRPLFWEFPSDPRAATVDTEWMFGDALLAAPIVTEGAATKTVYLPPGQWFDYSSGRSYKGAQSITIPADSQSWKDIPLFIRDGSILAMQPVEQYVSQRPISQFTLDVFPSQTTAAFIAYDDDGETYNYEKGDYLRQQVTAQRTDEQVSVTIDSATGTYAGNLRTYLVRIHAAAHRVLLDGRTLPEVSPGEALSNPDTNWAGTSDRFGPVVLLRVTAGSRKPLSIALQ